MWRDLRLAARMLLQAKAWTGVVLVSVALGIGANTALFSAINGLLLRKLAVADPDSLVRFRYAGENQMARDVVVYGRQAPDSRGRRVESTFSYPTYLQFAAANKTMSEVFACASFGRLNVVVDGQADIATGFLSSGNYYRALGATARAGRIITPADDEPAAAPVAVISHKYWMSRFGGSPDAVGAAVRVNDVPVTIVGVLQPDFGGVQLAVREAPDVALPLALEPRLNVRRSRLSQPAFWWLDVMGRLKPGISMQQVHGNLAGVFRHAARAGFDSYLSSLSPEERAQSDLQNQTAVPELLVDSGSRGVYDADDSDLRAVTVLTGVVALVLLLVCANVANLILSRSAARQKELTVRLALGATRARLIRQLLTESLVLAGLGGALGILVGRWGQQLLPGAAGAASPLDWRVMAFAIAITAGTGLVFGIAPALRSTRADANLALKEHGRGIAGGRGLLGRSLVVVQVAISIVVLIGAGLFLRTLQNLRQVDVGFNPRNVALFEVSAALNRYDAGRQDRLYERIGENLRGVGGVRSVSWSDPRLMSGGQFRTTIFVDGRSYAPEQRDRIPVVAVSPTFFETMEMPLVAGRGFTARDGANAPRVAVINEAAARTFFPNESPIGRRIGPTLEASGSVEIVGVLRDAKYNDVRDTPPTRYTPFAQGPHDSATFEVRTHGDPLAVVPGIRQAVRQVDPDLPIINVTTQTEEVEGRFAQEKLFARAYLLFGGLALVVASVGLFGLMSYSVARRTSEIGIRMALGAERRDVMRMVMRESMGLVVAGAAVGVAGAVAGGRLLAALLFGLAPTDPATYAAAIVLTGLVSLAAGYLPALRASRVDPMTALRCE